MNEPYVSVGVLSGKSIKFTLKGIYSTDDDAIVTGEQEATLSDSGIAIVWNGKNYSPRHHMMVTPLNWRML